MLGEKARAFRARSKVGFCSYGNPLDLLSPRIVLAHGAHPWPQTKLFLSTFLRTMY